MHKKILAFVLLLTLSIACEKMQSDGNESGSNDLGTFPMQTNSLPAAQDLSLAVANVVFPTDEEDAEPVVFTVEVAQTPEALEQGLQYRDTLAENHGMWFVFPEDVQAPFWMKNMNFPLDILFIDSEYTIVDIIENAEPNNEEFLYPGKDHRYVLEVNAGTVEKLDLEIGDQLKYQIGN